MGPVGIDNEVTDFYFDQGASCSGATYTPDHLTLRQKMREEWLPQGIDMKGFVHSHPGRCDRLSAGDLVYIRRLLDRNADMSMFVAPIVVPSEFRIHVMVVLRSQPTMPLTAQLHLF